jgi:hypothetical protein
LHKKISKLGVELSIGKDPDKSLLYASTTISELGRAGKGPAILLLPYDLKNFKLVFADKSGSRPVNEFI